VLQSIDSHADNMLKISKNEAISVQIKQNDNQNKAFLIQNEEFI
jgi:hypothetical protein